MFTVKIFYAKIMQSLFWLNKETKKGWWWGGGGGRTDFNYLALDQAGLFWLTGSSSIVFFSDISRTSWSTKCYQKEDLSKLCYTSFPSCFDSFTPGKDTTDMLSSHDHPWVCKDCCKWFMPWQLATQPVLKAHHCLRLSWRLGVECSILM